MANALDEKAEHDHARAGLNLTTKTGLARVEAPLEPLQSDIAKPPSPARKAQVARELARLLPEGAVLWRDEDLRPYECDGLSAFRQLPMVVVMPLNEAQVIEVLRCCHRLEVPVVARGAGTGLSGGAMPHASGVVLSLARLNKILHRGRSAIWSLLCTRPLLTNRLHDRRQCR
jgi:hypothetical protein